MNRVVVLFVIAVALVGATIWAYSAELFGGESRVRSTKQKSTEVEPLPAIDVNLVHSIEIKDQNGTIKVSRSGESWVLPEIHGGPAMAVRIDGFMKSWAEIGRSPVVARKKHSTFQLDEEHARHVKLLDDTGKVILSVLVGKQDQPRGGGARTVGTYMRRPGEDAVFRVRGRFIQNMNTNSLYWLERRILHDIDNTKINDIVKTAHKIEIEFDDLDFAPQRPGEDPRPQVEDPKRLRVVLEREEVAAKADEVSTGPVPAAQQPLKPKPGEKTWQWKIREPADSAATEVNNPAAEAIARSLLFLRMDDIAGRDATDQKFGLDDPVIDLTVHFEGAESYNLKIGNEVPEAERDQTRQGNVTRYAHMAGRPFVVTLNQFMLTQFAKKPDAFKKPDTPTAPTGRPKIALPEKTPTSQPVKKPDKQ